MAAADVAAVMARVAEGAPVNRTIEVAGPEQFPLDGLIRQYLAARNDPRQVISDSRARFFGGELSERTLVPDKDALLGKMRFESWLSKPSSPVSHASQPPSDGKDRRRKLGAGSKSLVSLAALFAITLGVTGILMAQEKITPLMTNDLAGSPGKEIMMYTVDFPAGFSSPIHRHDAQVSVYVLEGSVVMQVRGGKEVTLGPGQSFYENPSDIHVVSRNASSTKPAKFLVFLIKEKGAPMVLPAK
jgi:quercetin dioxygenase-like cupin family protein